MDEMDIMDKMDEMDIMDKMDEMEKHAESRREIDYFCFKKNC